MLCDDVQGIIVNTNIGWAHISCINWTPEIWFDNEQKTLVGGKLNKDRFGLFCYICKKKKKSAGSCIQCDYKDCAFNFHVRCAMKESLIMRWDDMD